MNKYFIVFIYLTSFLFAKTFNIGDLESYNINNSFKYKIENNASESVTNISKLDWINSQQALNTFENRNKAYWLKLNLENNTSKNIEYYLMVDHETIYQIEFFLVKNGKVENRLKAGLTEKAQDNLLEDNHIIFPIKLKSKEGGELFIKIKNFNKLKLHFSLVNKKYLLTYYQKYNFFEALFFGGMIMMMLYNFLLYFIMKSKVYLYYASYIFFSVIYFFGFFGYLEFYLSELKSLYLFSYGFLFIFLTLFFQNLFDTKKYIPKIHKLLNIYNGYQLVTMFFYYYAVTYDVFFLAQILNIVFFTFLILYVLVIMIASYYLAWGKHIVLAKIYAIVWTSVFVVLCLFSLHNLNLIYLDADINYILQYLTLLETLTILFIFSYHQQVLEENRKKQEELLIRQNKMATMGEMISLIVHQWRQPLSAINGTVLNLEIDYRKKILDFEKLSHHLDELEETTKYMSNTIEDFSNFFSPVKYLEKFYIADVIKELEKIPPLVNTTNIQLICEDLDKVEITSYKSELIQALLILLNNAVDACQERLKAFETIELLLSVREIKGEVLISIEDNGGGIDRKIKDEIFTPYYTTKNNSTGLGLYILKLIVENSMAGKVYVENGKRGAVFTIQFENFKNSNISQMNL